jgi:hypothetical protein
MTGKPHVAGSPVRDYVFDVSRIGTEFPPEGKGVDNPSPVAKLII